VSVNANILVVLLFTHLPVIAVGIGVAVSVVNKALIDVRALLLCERGRHASHAMPAPVPVRARVAARVHVLGQRVRTGAREAMRAGQTLVARHRVHAPTLIAGRQLRALE
jgi:hypothetical protein